MRKAAPVEAAQQHAALLKLVGVTAVLLQGSSLTVKGYITLQQASMPGGCMEGVRAALRSPAANKCALASL